MTKRWISQSDLMALTGWSDRTVQRKCNRHEIEWREVGERTRNGKFAREYSTLSLPPEFQLELAKQPAKAACQTAIIPVSKTQTSAIEVAEPSAPSVASSEVRQPTNEEQRKQIEERFQAISLLIAYVDGGAEQKAHMRTSVDNPLPNSDAVAKYLAAKNGVSRNTIWRWYSRFKKSGPCGLLDEIRSDKGQSRFFVTHPQAATFVQDKFLNECLSIKGTFRAFCAAWTGSPCTYETLRTYLLSLPAPLVTLARKGRRAYTDRMAPYIKRAFTDVFSNEIWVSDHMIFDIEAQNDVFIDAPRGAPIRMRLTDLEDFRSRYIVGVSFSWEGSSRSIGSAMLHACATYGPCEELYCDNGKDYKKVGKGALPGYLRESELAVKDWHKQEMNRLEELGLLAHIGIAVRYCQPFHPQAKHVERFHRTLHEQFCKLFPTYTGGRPDRRPDSTTARMGLHRKLLRAGTPELSDHPLASDVIRCCLQWIDEYNRRPHTGEGMHGLSPAEVFFKYLNPKQRPPMERQTLALMIAEKERRVVRECAVQFSNNRYIGSDEVAAAVLHQMNEREVIVAFDPLWLSDVAILDLDGRLLCWARMEELLPQSSAANEAVAESMKQRRRLERGTRDQLTAIAQANRQIGARSEVELLDERSRRLPVAVGDFVTQRGLRKCAASAASDNHAVAPASAAEIAKSAMRFIHK